MSAALQPAGPGGAMARVAIAGACGMRTGLSVLRFPSRLSWQVATDARSFARATAHRSLSGRLAAV
eukprot:scaffold11591_cov105-Isochrysis_galbana.AAC.1